MPQTKPILLMAAVLLTVLAGCTKDSITENQVPIANAGPARTVDVYYDSLTLYGSGSDTDGHVVAYLWSQVSGPDITRIVNPGSPSTLIKGFGGPGTYVYQLMVTDDKGATGVDTTTVTVTNIPSQVLTLQPSNNPDEVQLVNYNGVDQSGVGNGRIDIPLEAWTDGGLPVTIREILKFDLSGIPANATIVGANLILYAYPSPTLHGNLSDPNYGADNSFTVQQITTAWTFPGVDWFNQPATTTANQVITDAILPPFDVSMNVLGMVKSMMSNNANYGFMLKLKTETPLKSRILVSSYNTTYPAKHPKLIVMYRQ